MQPPPYLDPRRAPPGAPRETQDRDAGRLEMAARAMCAMRCLDCHSGECGSWPDWLGEAAGFLVGERGLSRRGQGE